jgi:8-oxo-dGTP pyrophosphatase MutT (NUDIX family)
MPQTRNAGKYWRPQSCAVKRIPGVPDLDTLSLEQIRARLHAQADTTYDVPPELLSDAAREAAVLVPFVRIDDAWNILYIRRTSFEGDRHSGQVAFAGGKRDDIDNSLLATALREAEEEIGLAPGDVEVLGYINHHHTISEFQVRPYVAAIPWPYDLIPDGVEVARIFSIPLRWLADESNYRTEQRQHPQSQRPWPVVYYDRYDGELLWGATARMTLSLLDVLRGN